MTTPFHALEIIVYALLNLLPYVALALLMFWGALRFSRGGTALLVLVLCLVQIAIGFCATVLFPAHVALISILGYVVYIAFFIVAVRAPAGPLAFLMLLEANYASFVVCSSKYLESLLFPKLAAESHRLSLSLAMLLVQLVTLPLVGVFTYKKIRPSLSLPETKKLWRFLWVIPLTFYLAWFYLAYMATDSSAAEIAMQRGTTLYVLLLNLGAFVVYNAVANMVEETARRRKLEAEIHELELQNLQLSHLEERMSEARRARHDLRQHYNVLLNYADGEDLRGIKEYLEQFRDDRTTSTALCYCQNSAVNALLVYYLDRAKAAGAQITAHVELPEQLAIPDGELTVLLGNLLENAVEALERQETGEKKLRLTAKAAGMLVITLDNSCDGQVQESHGRLLSSKRKGTGLGTASVRAIAQKHAGVVKLEHEAGQFRASALLPL